MRLVLVGLDVLHGHVEALGELLKGPLGAEPDHAIGGIHEARLLPTSGPVPDGGGDHPKSDGVDKALLRAFWEALSAEVDIGRRHGLERAYGGVRGAVWDSYEQRAASP